MIIAAPPGSDIYIASAAPSFHDVTFASALPPLSSLLLPRAVLLLVNWFVFYRKGGYRRPGKIIKFRAATAS